MTGYTLFNTANTKEHGDFIEMFLEDQAAGTKRETVDGADSDFPKLTYTYDNGATEDVVSTIAIMKSLGKSVGCYP